MTKSTSFFLDLLRLVAALFVFGDHSVQLLHIPLPNPPGHYAVIIFFVLSGYVIAFSVMSGKNLDLRSYAIARLSRLYSVVIPALLLCLVLSIAKPVSVHEIAQASDLYRYMECSLFLQSIWWQDVFPPHNPPFWSLGYEFWYYVLFGIAIYIKPWKWKIALLVLASLIVGIKVLLLFPIWLVGVFVFLFKDGLPISKHFAAVFFVIMLFVCTWALNDFWQYPMMVTPSSRFYYSGAFLSDGLVGLKFGCLIWFYTRAFAAWSCPSAVAKVIQWGANHTFSLYLYHYPILLVFANIHIFNFTIWWHGVIAMVLVLAIITLLAEQTESRRYLWKKGFEGLFSHIEASMRYSRFPGSRAAGK